MLNRGDEITMKVLSVERNNPRNVWLISPMKKQSGIKLNVPPDDSSLNVPLSKIAKPGCSLTVQFLGNDEKGLPQFGLSQKYFALKLGIQESKTVEFKKSVLYVAKTSALGQEQPRIIAATIASFINEEGGELYVGIANDGSIVGIENDLKHLNDVVINGTYGKDEGFSYGEDEDAFKLKIASIVRFMLGDAAVKYVDEVEFVLEEGGRRYAKIPIRKAENEIIYCPLSLSYPNTTVAYYRNGPSKNIMSATEVEKKLRRIIINEYDKRLKPIIEVAKLAPQVMNKIAEIADDIKNSASSESAKPINGSPVGGGGFPLDANTLADVDKPDGVIICGKVYASGGHSWKDAFLALLQGLYEGAPERFDELPAAASLRGRGGKAYFKKRGTRSPRFSSASPYMGTVPDIVAELAGIGKSTFSAPDGRVRKLLDFFGVECGEVRIWKQGGTHEGQ